MGDVHGDDCDDDILVWERGVNTPTLDEELEHLTCPVCKENETEFLPQTDEDFAAWHCIHCDLIWDVQDDCFL